MNGAFVEGVVVDTSDPQEAGRFKVWCPSIDGDVGDGPEAIETLPWVRYISPFGGSITDFPGGANETSSGGPMAYGFWATPKIGAEVVIAFLYNDPNQRIYMGSFWGDLTNRSLPTGRNIENSAPQTDSYQDLEPQKTNLSLQFAGKLDAPEARTRGAYERQAAHLAGNPDEDEGYSTRVGKNDQPGIGDYESQTFCFTTPGRHAIIMQDNPKFARVRVKTADGSQIILDDANERIYISTARGNSWIEMDIDGHIHVYSDKSISFSAAEDINFSAGKKFTVQAGSLHLGATGEARFTGGGATSIFGNGLNLESNGGFNILAAGDLIQTGSNIHLNGPSAAPAECAEPASITPSHEPWVRPTSENRNKNWKP